MCRLLDSIQAATAWRLASLRCRRWRRRSWFHGGGLARSHRRRQVSDAQAAALERCQRHQVFEGDGRPIAGLVAGHVSATLDVIPADEAEEPADEE